MTIFLTSLTLKPESTNSKPALENVLQYVIPRLYCVSGRCDVMQNLELALRLTSRWADWTSKHLSDDSKRLYETQSRYNDKKAEKAGLEAKVSQLQKSLEPLEKQVADARSEVESSRRKYDAARAAYDKAVKNRNDWDSKSMCEKAALAGPGRGECASLNARVCTMTSTIQATDRVGIV